MNPQYRQQLEKNLEDAYDLKSKLQRQQMVSINDPVTHRKFEQQIEDNNITIRKLEAELAGQSSPVAISPTQNTIPNLTPRELREKITSAYSLEELRDLCQDLSVDYDSLPGEGKAGKARELVAYMERRKRLPDLISEVMNRK